MTNAETTDTAELSAEEVALLVADAPAADPAAFVPTDAAGVDWVLGKMADARARAARIRENAEKMARAEERQAEMLEWKYGADLRRYANNCLAGGKKKSLRLYNGQIGFRTKPESVTITDEAGALAWVKTYLPGSAIIERVDKKEVASVLLSTGEAVPFATYQEAEEVFYIK